MINERLTKAIAVPTQFRIDLDDGRILMLTAWNPVVEAGGIVRLNASFIIRDQDGNVIQVNGNESDVVLKCRTEVSGAELES